jgi:hypothetical protein
MPRKVNGQRLKDSGGLVVRVRLKIRRTGGRKTILPPEIMTNESAEYKMSHDALVRALAKAHRWRRQIEDGEYASIAELARANKINESYACRVLRLSLLSPELTEQSLAMGSTRTTVQAFWKPFSTDWARQRID